VGGPARNFYIEQMLVSVRMHFHNHVGTQPVKRFEKAVRCIYDIKFGMLQVRKNEISLCECSGSSAHLHIKGTLVTREPARFENNDSEPVANAENLHGRWFIQWHTLAICIWCALFVMSQFDVILMFPNKRFGEVR